MPLESAMGRLGREGAYDVEVAKGEGCTGWTGRGEKDGWVVEVALGEIGVSARYPRREMLG